MIEEELPTGPRSAAAARRLLTTALGQLRGADEELVDRVVLVASELVTNAVLHGGDAPRLVLRQTPGGIRLEVFDRCADLPAPRKAAADDLHGRGLLLVDDMADGWGVEPLDGGAGKAVWAEFTLGSVS